MARTSTDSVIALIADNYDSEYSAVMTAAVETAHALTNQLDARDTSGKLSDADLELIERYLAAHFYGNTDQFFATKQTGPSGGSFQGGTTMNLGGTKYGQTAMVLDVTNWLSKRNAEVSEGSVRSASVSWLGVPKEEDYVEESYQ